MTSLHPMDVAEAEDREAARCDTCDGTGMIAGRFWYGPMEADMDPCPDCKGRGYLEPKRNQEKP